MLLVIEYRLQGRLDQILGGEISVQGVDVLLILVELKMQMRSGCSAGRTNITDDLSLRDSRAVADPFGKPIEMSVTGCVCGIVLNFHRLAVNTIPVYERNCAITDRADRGTSFGGEVHPRMGYIDLQNGVKAGVRKVRSDIGELQRESEEGAS